MGPLDTALPWMSPLHLEALMRFEGLPSTLLHPERIATLLPSAAAPLFDLGAQDSAHQAQLHRHWSQALRDTLKLAPITHYGEPALRVACLPKRGWDPLIPLAGAMLGAPGIRRLIAQDAVAALQSKIGTDAVTFACVDAGALHAGLSQSVQLSHAELAEWCPLWGAALLWRAFEASSTAVAERAWLRLPEQAKDWAQTELPQLDADQALALVFELTERTDPSWLLSFPATP